MEFIQDLLFVIPVGILFLALCAFIPLCIMAIVKAITHKGPDNILKMILLDVVIIIVCFILGAIFEDDSPSADTAEITTAATTVATTEATTLAPTTTTTETTTVTTTTKAAPAPPTINYYNAYVGILEDMRAAYGEYTEYAIYDMDGNGVKELFVVGGISNANMYISVYTVKNGSAVYLGEYAPGASSLHIPETGDGVYVVYGHMNYQKIDRLTTDGNTLIDTVISEEGFVPEYYNKTPQIPYYYVGNYSPLS